MSIITTGKVAFTPRGFWADSQTYTKLDVVSLSENHSVYVCLQNHVSSESNKPSIDGSETVWRLLVAGPTGNIIYKNLNLQVPASSWTQNLETLEFTQEISLDNSGITSDSFPFAMLGTPLSNITEAEQYDSYKRISYVETANEKLKFHCIHEKPSVDINLILVYFSDNRISENDESESNESENSESEVSSGGGRVFLSGANYEIPDYNGNYTNLALLTNYLANVEDEADPNLSWHKVVLKVNNTSPDATGNVDITASSLGLVQSVNGITPDPTIGDGNIVLNEVPVAFNLYCPDNIISENKAYTFRTTAGNLSILDGNTELDNIKGNSTINGRVEESLTCTTQYNDDIKVSIDEQTWKAYSGSIKTGEIKFYTYWKYVDPDSQEPADIDNNSITDLKAYGVYYSGKPVDNSEIEVVCNKPYRVTATSGTGTITESLISADNLYGTLGDETDGIGISRLSDIYCKFTYNSTTLKWAVTTSTDDTTYEATGKTYTTEELGFTTAIQTAFTNNSTITILFKPEFFIDSNTLQAQVQLNSIERDALISKWSALATKILNPDGSLTYETDYFIYGNPSASGYNYSYTYTFICKPKWVFNNNSLTEANLSNLGVTVIGEPKNSQSINISYTAPVIGVIHNPNPKYFKSVGFNLYQKNGNTFNGLINQSNIIAEDSSNQSVIGFVQVPKADDESIYTIYNDNATDIKIENVGFCIGTPQIGTSLDNRAQAIVSPILSYISIPQDGYICVQIKAVGQYSTLTTDDLSKVKICIHPKWSGYRDTDFEEYKVSVINIPQKDSNNNDLPFIDYGLPSVDIYQDIIDFSNKIYYQYINVYPITKVEGIDYVTVNDVEIELSTYIDSLTVPYDYDATRLYVVRNSPNIFTLSSSIDNNYDACDFGIEGFYDGNNKVISYNIISTSLYSQNLRDKLRIDVLTSTELNLTEDRKEVSRNNIDAQKHFWRINGSIINVPTVNVSTYKYQSTDQSPIDPLTLKVNSVIFTQKTLSKDYYLKFDGTYWEFKIDNGEYTPLTDVNVEVSSYAQAYIKDNFGIFYNDIVYTNDTIHVNISQSFDLTYDVTRTGTQDPTSPITKIVFNTFMNKVNELQASAYNTGTQIRQTYIFQYYATSGWCLIYVDENNNRRTKYSQLNLTEYGIEYELLSGQSLSTNTVIQIVLNPKYDFVKMNTADFDYNIDYPYRATINRQTNSDIDPTEAAKFDSISENTLIDVILDLPTTTLGIVAPVARTYNGYIVFYLAAVPENSITIPHIICWE